MDTYSGIFLEQKEGQWRVYVRQNCVHAHRMQQSEEGGQLAGFWPREELNVDLQLTSVKNRKCRRLRSYKEARCLSGRMC